MSVSRRLLMGGVAFFLSGLKAEAGPSRSGKGLEDFSFEVEFTPVQWRRKLSDAEYRILRLAGTEKPFSSPLNAETRDGIYVCAGCDTPVFDSVTKFDAGTGWPSFYQALESGVIELADESFGMHRTAVHCRRCGGHLGHVFTDGPLPTGMRYCINGIGIHLQVAEQ